MPDNAKIGKKRCDVPSHAAEEEILEKKKMF